MSVDAEVWLRRNQVWACMTHDERRFYVQGQMNTFRDIFDAFSQAFKTSTDLHAVFEELCAAYDIEIDRATVAGIL